MKLEFDTEPDYNKCRKMFRDALIKRKYPLDGKIDFSIPKTPAKKVRKSSPVKKRKSVVVSSAEDSESPSEIDESIEEEPVPVKRRRSPVKKESKSKPTAKRVALMKDSSSQTSPAFVKAASAARRAAKNNPEMEEFVKKAKTSAKKATAAASPKKAPATKKAAAVSPKKTPATKKASQRPALKTKTLNGSSNPDPSSPSVGLSNPTPAMLALMEKRAANESAKKRKR